MVCPYLVEMDIVIMDKHTNHDFAVAFNQLLNVCDWCETEIEKSKNTINTLVKYDTYDVVDVCYEHGKIRAYTNILELIRGEKRP